MCACVGSRWVRACGDTTSRRDLVFSLHMNGTDSKIITVSSSQTVRPPQRARSGGQTKSSSAKTFRRCVVGSRAVGVGRTGVRAEIRGKATRRGVACSHQLCHSHTTRLCAWRTHLAPRDSDQLLTRTDTPHPCTAAPGSRRPLRGGVARSRRASSTPRLAAPPPQAHRLCREVSPRK